MILGHVYKDKLDVRISMDVPRLIGSNTVGDVDCRPKR